MPVVALSTLRNACALLIILFALNGCGQDSAKSSDNAINITNDHVSETTSQSDESDDDTDNKAPEINLTFVTGRTLAAGFTHTCAIIEHGQVKCWGEYQSNNYDNPHIGDPNEMGAALPAVDLGLGSVAVEVAAGTGHTCALLDNGQVNCWGENGSGQLGEPGYPPFTKIDLGSDQLAVQIVTGRAHTCALLHTNQVKCWGDNSQGQLGLGDTETRGDDPGEMGDNLPAVDLGTNRHAIQITAGSTHTCAVLDNGQVKCWGDGWNGGLGLGDAGARGDNPGEMGDALPAVDLGTGRTAVSIAAGGEYTCAILDNGELKCWGFNWTGGQIGVGDLINRGDLPGTMGDALPAVDLGTGITALEITAGQSHTCALLDNAQIKCWGSNEEGQLGLGDTLNRGGKAGEMGDSLPVVDLGVDYNTIEITAGFGYTCARLNTGAIKCWGDNTRSQLGQGDGGLGNAPGEMGDALPPINLGTGRTTIQVALADFRTCALLDTHQIKCWGQGTPNDQGIGVSLGDELPTLDLGAGRTATQITTSWGHTCALLDNGQVNCWGEGWNGQLGQGNTYDQSNPIDAVVDLGIGRTAIKIATGGSHNCALLDNGQIKCWGNNNQGQLGLGDTDNRGDDPDEMGDFLPYVDLGSGRTATQITASYGHTCALLDNGQVKCWGNNWIGELGQGDADDRGDNPGEMGDALPAIDLGTGRTAVIIAISSSHTCAVLDNGRAKCWGYNSTGMLGLGDTISRGYQAGEMGDALPYVDLGDGRTVLQISTGESHTCALLDNAQMKCWGENADGELGLEDSNSRGSQADQMGNALPAVDLGTGRTAVQIATGLWTTCAVLDSLKIKCWGNRIAGALGRSTDYIGDVPEEMGDALPEVQL